jgi:hypothetical protein
MTSKRDWNINWLAAKQQPNGSWKLSDGTTRWYNDIGEHHKEDGPAIIHPSGYAGWFLNGEPYDFGDWCVAANKTDEQKLLLRLQYD